MCEHVGSTLARGRKKFRMLLPSSSNPCLMSFVAKLFSIIFASFLANLASSLIMNGFDKRYRLKVDFIINSSS